ncbi:MAG: polyketide synthase, partial [Bacteroidota bacterium]|nr:polyketide synthase [Bacteroidota bacterium]
VNLYYDNDPKIPDKTYSKIGSWVTDFQFNPIQMRIPIPPTVLSQIDLTQQWGIAASHQAMADFGYPERSFGPDRMAVILGNSNAGERHYRSTMRILLPEYIQALTNTDAFRNLPAGVQQQLVESMQNNIHQLVPAITEDTMSGELSNIIAGRIANVFNFKGPNYMTDAACASSLAAVQSAIQGLNDYQYDTVLTGGVDRNMGPESYVKFSKIGALSSDGSRPYADGANGFVMGEGSAVLLLKRLADAERDGDKIYAVIRGIGSSSDGKGKGITAPNPIGQQKAIERAWKNAGVSPASVGLIEGHGTSTRVGDVVEVNSLNEIFGKSGLANRSVALGSVKSNIGHLKS